MPVSASPVRHQRSYLAVLVRFSGIGISAEINFCEKTGDDDSSLLAFCEGQIALFVAEPVAFSLGDFYQCIEQRSPR